MSDLFPLVGEVLKDQACIDYQAEIEKLRLQLKQRDDVLLSGNISRVFDEDGEPLKEEDRAIYATCSIERENACTEEGDHYGSCSKEWDYWHTFFHTKSSCPLSRLNECEFSLFGAMQHFFMRDATVSGIYSGRAIMSFLVEPAFKDSNIISHPPLEYLEEICNDGLHISLECTTAWHKDDDDYIGLYCRVIGWPEDEPLSGNVLSGGIDYLVNVIAHKNPNATIEYIYAKIHVERIGRSLRRLLPESAVRDEEGSDGESDKEEYSGEE